jgi:hypothetical protein
MKKLIFAAIALSSLVYAQSATSWTSDVKVVTLEANKTVSVTGKFEDGKPMEDLRWASTSSMACFPATQNANFRGNHVFFATRIPTRGELRIKLIPKDTNQKTSIYAYTIGTTNFRQPPAIQSATTCEAEHTWDRPKKDKTQDHTRPLPAPLVSMGNPYNVFVGVSGTADVKAGEFTLEFEWKQ